MPGGIADAIRQLVEACERQAILSRMLWPLAPSVDVTPWARAWWVAAARAQSELERAFSPHAQPLSGDADQFDPPTRQTD